MLIFLTKNAFFFAELVTYLLHQDYVKFEFNIENSYQCYFVFIYCNFYEVTFDSLVAF